MVYFFYSCISFFISFLLLQEKNFQSPNKQNEVPYIKYPFSRKRNIMGIATNCKSFFNIPIHEKTIS